MDIKFARFSQLDTLTLYALVRLRVDVFVVEQACAYPELDGRDIEGGTVHVLGFRGPELVAYARILDSKQSMTSPNSKEPRQISDRLPTPITIGRVLVAACSRGQGLARLIMQATIEHAQLHYPDRAVKLSAQVTVQQFYESLGFQPTSSAYMEDGIEHIDMLLPV